MGDLVAPYGLNALVTGQTGGSAPAAAAPSPAPASAPQDGPWSDYAVSPPASASQAAPVQATQTGGDGPWSDYQAAPQGQQAASGRDALGGYLLPPDPGQQPAERPSLGTRLDQYGRSLAQGVTFGFGDEISAGLDAATHGLLGRGSDASTYGERYDANLAAERAKDAAIPSVIAIPGQILGGTAGIVAGAPAAIGRGVLAGARAIPGVAGAVDAIGAGAEAAGNALSRIPGASVVAPVAGIAAEGAGYGAVQGFGDGQGGFEDRLGSAALGAGTGAVLAPVVAGAGTLVGKGVGAARNLLGSSGFGAKVPVVDAAGQPIIGSDGQPVTASAAVTQGARQQLADATADIPAARAALDNQPPEVLPGDRPTTFQVTGDYGHGQKELELRNTPGASQAFLARGVDQNAARVNAIAGSVPADASSADLQNALTARQTALTGDRDAAAAQAGQGTLQGVGGVADSTPTQAGATLRGAIDQARAPVLQVADAAVQRGQAQAAGAMDALGGVLSGDAGSAQQQFGQRFRATLDSAAQDSKSNASRLYAAVDPDGTLAVSMQPVRQVGRQIVADLPENAAPLAGEEKAIFDTVGALPDAQSYRELGALNNRVTTAMRAARQDPTQAQTYARLSQLRGGLADVLSSAAEGQAAQDAAAVQAGTMAPEDSILSRIRAHLQSEADDFLAIQRTALDQTGGDAGRSSGRYSGPPQADVYPATGSQGQAGGRPGSAPRNPGLQGGEPLTPNLDQAAADRINTANATYAEHKATYGANAPGVGPVLAPDATSGTFRMPDSAVPSAIFSRGAGAAERVQAAVRAGLSPSEIADYAAFDLRRAAGQPDGSLNPAEFAKWRQRNGEALQALSQADPAVGRAFDTAQAAQERLAALQAAREALDTTHPLKPGWGDAETMQRVWQAGPKGADSVRGALAGANGSPVAAGSIADYAAYSLRRTAAPDGVINPAKFATWAKAYDGALSAMPELRAQFADAAEAQQTLNRTAQAHADALKEYQASVARHFLGGADPADRIGQILNSATRQRDMADLAKLTENDPAARAGIQRAVVDHIFNKLQGNSLAGVTERLKSDAFQTFIDRAAPALHDVMTPQQVETLKRVALTLQRDNTSIEATRVPGGSDTTQKAALLAAGSPGTTLLSMARAHGLTGLLTIVGAKMGGVGAFLGNAAGKAVASMKAAGIAQTSDLVKEAMLNPGLAKVLLAELTPKNESAVASAALSMLGKLAASRGAHTAVAVQHVVSPPPKPAPVRLNSLSQLGAALPPSPQVSALSRLGAL